MIINDIFKYNIEATIAHETTHQYTFSGTSYGLFQKVLFSLLTDQNTLDRLTRQRVLLILEHAIEESKVVHEGIATYIKAYHLKKYSSESEANIYLSSCGQTYRRGYETIDYIVDALDTSLIEKANLALIIAECCLNTDAFEYIRELLEYDRFTSIFDLIENNSPDKRLQNLYSCLSPPENISPIRLHINKRIKTDLSKETTNCHSPLNHKNILIKTIINQAIDQFVFPIYEEGKPQSIIERFASSIQLLNHDAKRLGYKDFPFYQIREVDNSDLMGKVRFHVRPSRSTSYKIIKKCFKVFELKRFLQEYYAATKNVFYVHLFDPILGDEELGYKQLARCRADENILIINRCSCNNHFVSKMDIVIKMKSREFVELLQTDMEVPIFFTTSFLYRVITRTRLEFLSIAKMPDNIMICYYLPDNTLHYLKLFSEHLFHEDVKYMICKNYNYNLHSILFLSKNKDIIFYTPVSEYTLHSYIEWANKRNPSIEWIGIESQERFFIEEHGNILMNHFLAFGY